MKTKALECVKLGAVYSEWKGKNSYWASVDFGKCSPTTYQLSVISAAATPEQAADNLERDILENQPNIDQWIETKGAK